MNLPTKEQYEAIMAAQNNNPKYQCPKCTDGGMCKDETIAFFSYPIKYVYECNKCGYVEVL